MRKLLLFLFLFFASTLFADIAKVVALKGEANITRAGQTIKVTKNSILKEKDILVTKNNTKVQLLFKDETIISIGKNSQINIDDYVFNEKEVKAQFSMVKGVFRTITGKIGKIAPDKFKLKTKSASIGIRGTQIVTDLSNNYERIFCTEGQIEIVQNDTKEKIIVNRGEFVSIRVNFNENLQKFKTKDKDIKEVNEKITITQNVVVDDIKKELIKEKIITKNQEKASSTLKEVKDKKETKEVQSKNQDKSKTSKEKEQTKTSKVEKVVEEKTSKEKSDTVKTDKTVVEKTKSEKVETETTISNGLASKSETTEENNSIKDNFEDSQYFKEDSSYDNFEELAPKEFFKNNKSTASYVGDFNDIGFNSTNQYLDVNNSKIEIPKDTSISMDIDFGKSGKNITNGKIDFASYSDINFEGSTKNSSFDLKGIGQSSGKGSGNFYGSEAEVMKGSLNLENSEVKIKGDFKATKK